MSGQDAVQRALDEAIELEARKNAEIHELAVAFTDEACERIVKHHSHARAGGDLWLDVGTLPTELQDTVRQALHYLTLRGRIRSHPQSPQLAQVLPNEPTSETAQ